MIRLALALLIAATLGAAAAPVTTDEGPVEGATKSGVAQFLGIPYAKPPVGNLRWMPPQPAAKWVSVRKADKFGPICAQVTTLGPFAGPPNSNEDCLYLNVFTPAVKAKLPVLVWIHGGGYYDGASNDYDPAKLVTKGKLVVVTLNYRLNLFGFMAHPAIDGEGHAFGNYGIMDMQAALKWVQRNIAAFGGDPDNVTLGGQSAGAGASAANVFSPGAKNLFHRAIFQSGGYTPFVPKAIAEEKGKKFAAAAGCTPKRGADGDMAKCLRALPAGKIEALAGTASETSPFITNPLVDGTVIPEQEIDLIRAGKFNKMPIMMGTTRDEGNFNNGIIQYFKKGRAALTEADYRAYLQRTYGGNAGAGGSPPAYSKDTIDKVTAHYPVAKAGAQMAWDAAHSDMLACRGQYTAEALSAHVPVYMYLFDDRTAQSYFPKMPGFQPLAYHTADIAYVFTGYHGGPQGLPFTLTATQAQLSDHLVTAWANFAHSGNPNGSGDAPWPKWKKGGDTQAYLLQNAAWPTVQTNTQFAAAHNCDFWSKILLYK
ncbi:MAG TPA: carboxylesterase family protein [Rhizomicrobium sp.]|nr:carboxylesterase family protein [Rhizomicrobium sp.]